MLIVNQHIQGPAAITLRFHTPTLSVDLTTVTAVTLNVLRRDGTTAQWVAQIVSATQYELVAQYIFSNGGVAGEITTTGLYYLSPALTVPGGVVATDAVQMFVTNDTGATPNTEQSVWVVETVNVLTLGPVKQTWANVTNLQSPFSALPVQPFIALDLRTSPITVNLWKANDGDPVVLNDIYQKAGTNAVTVVPASGQSVPTLAGGNYTSSALYNAAGNFPLRLKFQLSSNLWLPW